MFELRITNYTRDRPLSILVSACLLGEKVVFDGSYFSDEQLSYLQRIMRADNVKVVSFCPEDVAVGTPREIPDIHGGNGFDVLSGRAKVLDAKGRDISKPIIQAAQRMLEVAQKNSVELAIMMDMSASCGSSVISDGARQVENRRYQKGPGVCAALLLENGIDVISQRDYRSLEKLYQSLNPAYKIDPSKFDHKDTSWYREYFSSQSR